VTAASPRHIFAMKALAARTRDIDDLRLLADMIGVDSAEAACRYAWISSPMKKSHRGQPPSSTISLADLSVSPRSNKQPSAARRGASTFAS
jgi:hypothetical protein